MGIDAEMFVRTRAKVTPEQVRRWSYEIVERFGLAAVTIHRPGGRYFAEGRHALEIVTRWKQDGPDIRPKAGETFICVHLWNRYYGVGYERGNLPELIAIAEWCEQRIPGAAVWYGGDSSGVLAEPFGAEERRALFKHFVEHGHEPYRGGASICTRGPAPICEFCGGVPLKCSGGGRDRDFFSCHGCGWQVVRTADGKLHEVPEGKEFFDVSDALERAAQS